jgi:UDP-3-O-[3-hydroxymyristoyl] glucosamine N-acyltransferase
MVDTNFYKKNGSFKLGFLAGISESSAHNKSDNDIIIHDVAPIDDAKEGDITFLQNPKYKDKLINSKASACILSEANIDKAPKGMALLVSKDPYYSYTKIVEKFYHKENLFLSVSEYADVDLTSSIGNRTVIGSGVHIGPNCIIGRDCQIHPNVTIVNSIIGDNVIIHSGARIGQDGFGYAFHGGKHHKVLQIGRVIIENNVEIGANTTIDRGAGPDTIIGEGTKIDNLVQIGHNCKIGKHCIIVSQSGISGSTEVGDYTVIGGQAGISGHLKIGSRVQIAAKAGVMRDIEDGGIVGGYPAIPIKEWHRHSIIMNKLVKGRDDQES